MSLAIGAWLAQDGTAEAITHDSEFEKACLKAISVSRRESSIIVPPAEAMNIPFRQQIMSSNNLRPHAAERYRGFNPLDYRWLLK